MASDTIFAVSSGRPPAAIVIVRVSGSGALGAAAALAGDLPPARQAALRALRDPASGELLDEALVLRFDGPATATGEDLVEFHCHGGRAVVEAVLRALAAVPGLREALPGEFTRRAFANGRIDLTEAEGLADLIAAETQAQRRSALRMAEGGLSRQIEAWRARLVELSARAEAAIDYVDEDSVDGEPALVGECAALAGELGEWLERPRAEPLREGVRIVLAGPPNSGKSSLLNALAGQDRAIVSPEAGTTRDHIDVPLALGGLPLVITDTAGLRASAETIERIGVERAERLIALADILVWLGEPENAPEHPRLIRVHSRCDLPERGEAPSGSIAVSAMTGAGLDALAASLVAAARDLLPAEGELALNRRQAECIGDAYAALQHGEGDLAMLAEDLRAARAAFDQLVGRAAIDDVLDALFGRFCVGK